jgi:hypothetical protein
MAAANKLYILDTYIPDMLTRIILFLSSYAPLFLIIAMRGWDKSRVVAIIIAGSAVISVIVLFVFLGGSPPDGNHLPVPSAARFLLTVYRSIAIIPIVSL